MRPWSASLTVAAFALLIGAPAAGAAQPPDRRIDLTPGQAASWDGPPAVASNQNYDAGTGEPCGKDPDTYCDVTLLNTGTRPPGYYDTHTGALKVDLNGYTVPANDFDLYIYKSDASGTRGAHVGTSGGPPGANETFTVANPDGYYLVQVVYFATSGGYKGTAKLTFADGGPPANPDVDVPPGLQEVLASDPALGFRSHSEPHIAQSPTNPDLLIAGSKQYNRDPNSLKQYEFKIGTYVSFDRGRTWSDLGQIDVCPKASDAPPSSWPDANTCYPPDDPALAGTGAEDATDPRAKGDYGEEYIVSDIWVDFDDEGNAYAMVLDAPPFADGAGWGMTLHKWATPSVQDVKDGNTWGPRVIINAYPQEKGNTGKEDNGANPLGFLDDKNTFAVNNAGKDGDGNTGPIVACWGQNVATLIKQQVVCKRSTDAGKSFPGSPVPVSGQQQLVLGVATVADRKDPSTFYVYWKGYESSVATGALFGTIGDPGQENDDLGQGLGSRTVVLYGAMSRDGGQTFTPPEIIRPYVDVASPLPGATFRTGSIPQATQAPDGTIYIVYDAYNPSPKPGDADGRNADVMLIKSSDGLTFSAPVKVNQDTGNADQVQGQVATDPKSRVYVSYFDSRLTPTPKYLDTYLSVSSDAGKTFRDVRLSHDSSDTSINPPTSPSGAFYGDYQGLVADSCGALAFFNDTHLANDPARDPDFDQGLPRSEFQQVVATRYPGPDAAADPACATPPARSTAPLGPGNAVDAKGVSGSGGSCARISRFSAARVLPRGRRVRFDVRPRPAGRELVEVFQVARGRTLVRYRLVARFVRRGAFTWNGRSNLRRRIADGVYVVRMRNMARSGDVRRFVLQRSRGRWLRRGRFTTPAECSALVALRLTTPVFGGRQRRPLLVKLRLRRSAAVALQLRQGRRVLRRIAYKTVPAGRTTTRVFSPRGLRRGPYSVVVLVRRPGEQLQRRLFARLL